MAQQEACGRNLLCVGKPPLKMGCPTCWSRRSAPGATAPRPGARIYDIPPCCTALLSKQRSPNRPIELWQANPANASRITIPGPRGEARLGFSLGGSGPSFEGLDLQREHSIA